MKDSRPSKTHLITLKTRKISYKRLFHMLSKIDLLEFVTLITLKENENN